MPTLLLVGGVGAGDPAGAGLPVARGGHRPATGPGRPTGGCATAVREVSEELVIAPVEAELDAYATVRTGLAQALR